MNYKRNLAMTIGAAALAAWLTPTYAVAQSARYQFNVPSQDLGDALRALAVTTNQQIVFSEDRVRGQRSAALVGEYSLDQALDLVLRNSRLVWSRSPRGIIMIQGGQGDNSGLDAGEVALLPEVLVQGSGSLNADVRRTENDILPYVVFSRDEIQRSQATSVEEFLGSRLPMVTNRGTSSRNDPRQNVTGNRSSIDLRGLGSNQTLILVNGRRAPGVLPSRGEDLAQPDVNGIPIASIERIEILPGTASGIYGGGATGGVINIILRKDYSGTEVQLTYDNTFDTDSARRRVDVSTGFSLEGGRTQIMIAGSYSDGNDLLAVDRNFIGPARDAARLNAPEIFDQTATTASDRVHFQSLFGDLVLADGTPFGSSFGAVPVGYTGGAGLTAGAGVRDLNIVGRPGVELQGLSAVPQNQSVNLTIRRDMTDRVQAYLDLFATQSRSETRKSIYRTQAFLSPGAPGNPFQNYIELNLPIAAPDTVTTTTSATQRINAGLIAELGHGWTAGLDANLNRATNSFSLPLGVIDTSRLQADIEAGIVNPFRDLTLFPIDYSPYIEPENAALPSSPTYTEDYALRLAGPLMTLPAGPLQLTSLFSYRREDAPGFLNTYAGGTAFEYYHPRSQAVESVYVETLVPLVAPGQNVPLVNSLEAQLSVRWDHYTTTSSPAVQIASPDAPKPNSDEVVSELESTDYTVGLLYKPINDLSIRASYATGFLPPSLTQLLSFVVDSVMFVPDPLRGNEASFTPMVLTVGGSPDAKPEQSESESFGLIYTPSQIEGLRLSVDYVRIRKTDELAMLLVSDVINNEALLPGRVVRGDRLPGDPADYAGVVTALDASIINASTSRVEAFDIQADYSRTLGDLGWFRAYAVATVQTALERQITSSSPAVDRVGFVDGPGELRLNVGLDFERGPWSAAFNTQFYDGYRIYGSTADSAGRDYVAAVQGSANIPSQSYTDLSGRYTFDSGWLEGTQISVGIRNAFNQKPPLIATGELSGGYSTFGDPRLRTYSVSIRRSF